MRNFNGVNLKDSIVIVPLCLLKLMIFLVMKMTRAPGCYYKSEMLKSAGQYMYLL